MDEVYSILDTDINIDNYSFPIHHGAMNYLLRDTPSIFTRYAQSIWPFVSMVAIIAGMFASFKNRLRRKQKDRINSYYKDLLNIRKKATAKDADKQDLTSQMRELRTCAFEELGDNQIESDESFKIFLSLYSEIQEEING